jgi:hypothetical protein
VKVSWAGNSSSLNGCPALLASLSINLLKSGAATRTRIGGLELVNATHNPRPPLTPPGAAVTDDLNLQTSDPLKALLPSPRQRRRFRLHRSFVWRGSPAVG